MVETAYRLAHKCTSLGHGLQYAALETLLDPPSLPSSFLHQVLTLAPGSQPVCPLRHDDTIPTLIAVTSTLRGADCIVHLVGPESQVPFLADGARARRFGLPFIVCVCVTFLDDGDRRYNIAYSGGRTGAQLTEEVMLKTIGSLADSVALTVWSWDERFMPTLTSLVHAGVKTWMCNISTLTASTTPVFVGDMRSTRVMPFLTSWESKGVALVMSSGMPMPQPRPEVIRKIRMTCMSIHSRVLCSKTSKGRCFTCQYLCNLRSADIKGGTREVLDSTMRLTKRFGDR